MRKPRPNLIWPLILGGSVFYILLPFLMADIFNFLGVPIYLNILFSILFSLLFVLIGLIHVYLNFLWCKNVDLYFYREDEAIKK